MANLTMPLRTASPDRILDNQNRTVAHYLRAHLRDTDLFRVVSAYFTIYGYGLLADELDSVGRTRFLFGEPNSVTSLDPNQNDPLAFDLTDGALTPNQTLMKKALAKRCERWLRKRSVSVRSVKRSNFLHGKMYLADRDAGIVGSSNFTKGGLGGGANPNLEINLTVEDRDALEELREWFDRLWTDEGKTRNVKSEVLEALNRLTKNHSPEIIYYKTLYEIYRDQIDEWENRAVDISVKRLDESRIWNMLYEFQRDGVRSVINRLERYGGCILSDSVGLGKTYTALAVIKYYESRNERVLVLAPKKLRENWQAHRFQNNDSTTNRFLEDRFTYSLVAHTDLSRQTGEIDGTRTENFDWGNYDLVVIDESHNFRNPGGSRYRKLMDDIIKSGANTKVLMLSATPVNTSLMDLSAQIDLISREQRSHFSDTLNIPNTLTFFKDKQKSFKEWENRQGASGPDSVSLVDQLGPDFFRLLGGVSISRSRRQIQKYYSAELNRIGQFPRAATAAQLPPAHRRDGRIVI